MQEKRIEKFLVLFFCTGEYCKTTLRDAVPPLLRGIHVHLYIHMIDALALPTEADLSRPSPIPFIFVSLVDSSVTLLPNSYSYAPFLSRHGPSITGRGRPRIRQDRRWIFIFPSDKYQLATPDVFHKDLCAGFVNDKRTWVGGNRGEVAGSGRGGRGGSENVRIVKFVFSRFQYFLFSYMKKAVST